MFRMHPVFGRDVSLRHGHLTCQVPILNQLCRFVKAACGSWVDSSSHLAASTDLSLNLPSSAVLRQKVGVPCDRRPWSCKCGTSPPHGPLFVRRGSFWSTFFSRLIMRCSVRCPPPSPPSHPGCFILHVVAHCVCVCGSGQDYYRRAHWQSCLADAGASAFSFGESAVSSGKPAHPLDALCLAVPFGNLGVVATAAQSNEVV
jgi:hypothetical protein